MTDNSFGRLAGALFAPGKTFESIAQRPTWVVAWLVLVLALGVLGGVVNNRTDYGEMMRRGPQADSMTAEEIDQAAEFMGKFGPAVVVVQTVVFGCLFLFFALLYWVGFRMMGSELTFKQGLSTYLYAAAPMVVYCLLASLLLLGRSELSFEELQARDFLASHLGVFASEDTGLVLRSLLTSLDFFALWSVVLLIFGYRLVAKVSTLTSGVIVMILWLFLLGVRLLFAWLGSGGPG